MSSVQAVLRALIAVVVVAVLGATMCSFQVASNEAVVLTRFGAPVRALTTPGLHAKWPWPVDAVHRFDARLQFFETRLSEALTRDQRNVIIPVFVAWRVQDPQRFLEAVGSSAALAPKLDSLTTSARNALLGNYDFAQLVNSDPAAVRLNELEQRLARSVTADAERAFGISVVQVGVKRVALPEANTIFVFERMKAERAQHAAQFRAEGRREAEELRTRTDAERIVLLAEAQRYAEETRGRAEAEAARIYAEAHARDPQFYRFVRELESLKRLAKENTTLVVDTTTAPFNQLRPAAETTAPQ